jgi:hypothetical protein
MISAARHSVIRMNPLPRIGAPQSSQCLLFGRGNARSGAAGRHIVDDSPEIGLNDD